MRPIPLPRPVLSGIVAALTLALLVLHAPPRAHAAEAFLTTNGDLTAYGEGGGTVTFPSRYKLRLSGLWANDYCGVHGGDGRGIYLRAKAFLRGPDGWGTKNLGVVAYDNNSGCGNTPMFFDGRTWTFARQVRYIELKLCEEDRPSTTCLRGATKTYRNPRF